MPVINEELEQFASTVGASVGLGLFQKVRSIVEFFREIPSVVTQFLLKNFQNDLQKEVCSKLKNELAETKTQLKKSINQHLYKTIETLSETVQIQR